MKSPETGVLDSFARGPAVNAGLERCGLFVTRINRMNGNPFLCSTVWLGNNDILGNVDQLTGHVSRVSCLECSIGKTFTRTVGGDEILQHGEPLTEV
jgi:hypothetical protein